MSNVAYATPDNVREKMPDLDYGEDKDAIINSFLIGASRAIDAELTREPGAFKVEAAATKYFDGNGKDYLFIGELAEAPSSVAVSDSGGVSDSDYTVWAATDYFTWPYDAPGNGEPITRLDIDTLNGQRSIFYAFRRSVRIYGKWGFSTTVPEELIQALVIWAMKWYKRGQQGFQDTGAILEIGQLEYVGELDPEVKEILSLPKFGVVRI